MAPCDAGIEEIVAEEVAASLGVSGTDQRSRAQLARIANRMCSRVGNVLSANGPHQSGECVLNSERVMTQAQHPGAISLEVILRRFRSMPFGLNQDGDETGTLVGVVASLVDRLVRDRCDDTMSIASWWSEWTPDPSTCFRLCDRYGWITRGSDSPALWESPQTENLQERLAVRLLIHVQVHRYKFSQRWDDIVRLEHRAHSTWQADPYVSLVSSIALIPVVGNDLATVALLREQWDGLVQRGADEIPDEILALEIVGAARVIRTPEGAQALKELITQALAHGSDSNGVPEGVWTPLHLAVATRTSAQLLAGDERVVELKQCLKLLNGAQASLPGDDDFARAMEASIAAERASVESELQTLRLIDRASTASEAIVEQTRTEMESLREGFEARVKDSQLRAVEVLGIFSAAVAFAVAVPTLIVQGTDLTSERLLQLSAILGAVLLGFALAISVVANTLATGRKWTRRGVLALASSIVVVLTYVIVR